jgi:hypothetical protein
MAEWIALRTRNIFLLRIDPNYIWLPERTRLNLMIEQANKYKPNCAEITIPRIAHYLKEQTHRVIVSTRGQNNIIADSDVLCGFVNRLPTCRQKLYQSHMGYNLT